MAITPRGRVPRQAARAPRVSRQPTSLDNMAEIVGMAGVHRGTLGSINLQQVLGQQHTLPTTLLRRLIALGVPAICATTLYEQLTGLTFTIRNEDNEEDDNTRYYTSLLHYANDLQGGVATFFGKLILDVLSCQTGGFYEIVRNDAGVPIALYNMDGVTVAPSDDPAKPYVQYDLSPYAEYYEPEAIDQLVWRPFTEWELAGYNLTPPQIAYSYIAVLASTDKYTAEGLNEVIPMGLLNLGQGFNQAKATSWQTAWNSQMMMKNHANLGIVWGTDKIEFIPFRTPPKDMAFLETNNWYASLVASAFSMSAFDIGVGMSRVSTGAAAEAQTTATRTRGLKPLIQSITDSLSRKVLPEGYIFSFEDFDKRDNRESAAISQMASQAIATLVQTLGPEGGIAEAQEQGLIKSGKAAKLALAHYKEKKKLEAEQQQQSQENTQQQLQIAADKASGVGKDSTAQDSNPQRGTPKGRTQP